MRIRERETARREIRVCPPSRRKSRASAETVVAVFPPSSHDPQGDGHGSRMWRPAFLISVPATASAASGLIAAQFAGGRLAYFEALGIAGLVSLLAVAIVESARAHRSSVTEREITRRAEISDDPKVILARAEARIMELRAKAQTRRFFHVSFGGSYAPVAAKSAGREFTAPVPDFPPSDIA